MEHKIMQVRKKPVTVDAILWDGTEAAIAEITREYGTDGWTYVPPGSVGPGLWCKTPEGQLLATVGDYIIRGVKGEIYPCKPDVFRETYVFV
jgi:hypothetical protein